jgi:hypothetical protein
MERRSGGAAGNSEISLPALRSEFPQFRIWRETEGNRARYIARSLFPGVHPHTVVTPDLAELRAELRQGTKRQDPEADRR